MKSRFLFCPAGLEKNRGFAPQGQKFFEILQIIEVFAPQGHFFFYDFCTAGQLFFEILQIIAGFDHEVLSLFAPSQRGGVQGGRVPPEGRAGPPPAGTPQLWSQERDVL